MTTTGRKTHHGVSSLCWTLALVLAWSLGASPPVQAAGKWYTYDECTLTENRSNDGDSFHAARKRSHYIFRLYFVDTPETDLSFPDRVREQAAYWGISESDALKLGAEARAFTRRFLSGGFTAHSRREDARGRSNQPRYFAMIQVGRSYLSEALVSAGLARVYGHDTNLPDGTAAKKYWAKLRVAEREAKRANRGGWGMATGKQRVGSFMVRPVESRELVLKRSITVHTLDTPARFLTVLRKGTSITVLEADSPTTVKIRFRLEGHDREGKTSRSALGL